MLQLEGTVDHGGKNDKYTGANCAWFYKTIRPASTRQFLESPAVLPSFPEAGFVLDLSKLKASQPPHSQRQNQG